jgi:hypothetical protein
MGLGSFLKKSIKNSFRGGSLWNMGVDKLHDQVSNPIKEALGLNAFADIAAGQDAALKAQQAANQLNQANELQNVVQFEDGGTNVGGTDLRRKQRPTGSYAGGLGLRS